MKAEEESRSFLRNAFDCQYQRYWDCNDPNPPSDRRLETLLEEYIPKPEQMHLRSFTAADLPVVCGTGCEQAAPAPRHRIFLDHRWQSRSNPTEAQLKPVYDARDVVHVPPALPTGVPTGVPPAVPSAAQSPVTSSVPPLLARAPSAP
jgi:hypothetical protein